MRNMEYALEVGLRVAKSRVAPGTSLAMASGADGAEAVAGLFSKVQYLPTPSAPSGKGGRVVVRYGSYQVRSSSDPSPRPSSVGSM